MLLSNSFTKNHVSIPKRVSEALKPHLNADPTFAASVSIPKRVSEALKPVLLTSGKTVNVVSIPKRVSEALKLLANKLFLARLLFQSLKGFQRL